MKPCIYTGHYSEYKGPAAVCLHREVRGEETTGISYSQNTFLFIYYSITLNWPLTSSSSSRQTTLRRKWQPCWIRRKSNRLPGALWYESSNLTEFDEFPLWVNLSAAFDSCENKSKACLLNLYYVHRHSLSRATPQTQTCQHTNNKYI